MSSSDSAPSFTDRVSEFVSENRRAVIIGGAAAALALGGALYYASTSRPGGSDAEKGKKSKRGKRRGVNDADGPLLEEKKSRVEEEEADTQLTDAQIDAMPTDERKKLAATLKSKGNNCYNARNFAKAVDMYTQAIRVTPTPEPVFFSNRAASFMNMDPPRLEQVIQDCDSALSLDKNYVKALNRRATTLERLSRYEESLRDFTAATILNKFQDEAAAQSVERVLKKLSSEKAAAIMGSRERRLPSFTFVSAYFAAFRPRPLPTLPEDPTTGDNTLIMALQALEASNYPHSVTLVNEAIEQGISFDAGRAEALNLRGTFKFLMGDVDGAKEDLSESIKLVPSYTQSWVKIASVHMEQGDNKTAFDCFEEAIKHNPDDADIYYHRGQVLFITNEFEQAAENYTKSTSLESNFVFSHIQLAVAQYKMGNVGKAMATFRSTLTAFPQRSEPQNYYGELLLDQQRFKEAIEKFDRAIELERAKPPPMNVLALVNKGLAVFQSTQDIAAAEACCVEALEIDPECEPAVATLAQLSLQQSRIDRAIEMFARQTELARSEIELVNAITYQYASRAQLDFVENYPEMASQLAAMSRGMM
ncbi:ADP ATP carrier receptor [Coniophora puteana RWD-64-598 SS2]|uniref:ADP ATP carrier receptor n=1 Tax=Coniophora puteana (strain RWD-64-598) TaxID=741705 RepID=A0A5M3MFP4_CONPW|nr:ADP ATP carrier receptor [Coniophora puteana RWD-64-598 SS2]EIW77983.1 ADP ATP carrier receptor [Coniophora puteana RWD-64-598 SS2]